jgi:hypothetical protein
MSKPVSYSPGVIPELVRNWASRRAVVSIAFFDLERRRFLIRATARLVKLEVTSIVFDLHPQNWGSEPTDLLEITLDANQQWSEVTDDPLGGVRCRLPDRDDFLSIYIVPEGREIDLESATGIEQ